MSMLVTVLAVGFGALVFVVLAIAGAFALPPLAKTWVSGIVKSVLREDEEVMSFRVGNLERSFESLPRKWEEFRDETRKLAGRARYHVARVDKELSERGEEDPDITGLAGELQLEHGGGGEGDGVPELPAELGEVATPEQAEPDEMTAAFARKWARRTG